MLQIGEFSKMARTTVKTLRYYDEIGLLKPYAVGQPSGYRLYEASQLTELHRIQSLRQIGLSIDDIRFEVSPALTVVSVMHKGAYEEMGAAFAFAMEWISENGYAVAGEPRSSYIDGIWNKEDVSKWLTEVQIPVHEKA